MEQYRRSGCEIELEEDPFSLVIITPLMKRMVQFLDKSHSVFIDSTASCDQAKSSMTVFLVETKAGAIPVGIAIHKFQSEDNYTAVIRMLKRLWSEINLFTIENFMTDDSAALKAALRNLFPNVRQLLCQFHVPQTFWRWLWNSKNNVQNADRKPIMLLFRQIMYSISLTEFEENIKNFFESDTTKKYDSVVNYISNFLRRKEEWCQLFRLNVKNQSNNTNNYSEATVRVFKEIILTRLKAFNSIALMQFIVSIFEKYLSKRLLDAAFGRRKKNHIVFQKYLDKGKKVLEECDVRKDDAFYIVQSQSTSASYIVDFGICSCPIGIQGAFCKHQAAVQIKFGVMFPNAPILTTEEKGLYYGIAMGDENVPSDFLEPMVPLESKRSYDENTLQQKTVCAPVISTQCDADDYKEQEHRCSLKSVASHFRSEMTCCTY